MEYDERKIVEIIKKKLEKRGVGKIKVDFRPYATNFEKIWRQKYDDPIPTLQPQVDLVIKNGNVLDAIEIKYFKRDESRTKFNYPYYLGIDQAIAYLRFGFNHVALWQVFDNIPLSQFADYGSRVWIFLRELNLKIAFTYFLFNEEDESLKAKYNPDRNDEKLLIDLSELSPQMNWRDCINPYFLNSDESKKIRAVIDETNPIKSMT